VPKPRDIAPDRRGSRRPGAPADDARSPFPSGVTRSGATRAARFGSRRSRVQIPAPRSPRTSIPSAICWSWPGRRRPPGHCMGLVRLVAMWTNAATRPTYAGRCSARPSWAW